MLCTYFAYADRIGCVAVIEGDFYSRREARIDLCDFLLQNTTVFLGKYQAE